MNIPQAIGFLLASGIAFIAFAMIATGARMALAALRRRK